MNNFFKSWFKYLTRANIKISLNISLTTLLITTVLGIYIHYYYVKKLCKLSEIKKEDRG